MYNYGNMRMPVPQYSSQTGPTSHQPYNANVNTNATNFSGRSQTDFVMSKLSSQLDQADMDELQELHDKEEKIHQLLNENSEVKQVQAEREMQLASNRSVAEYNMNRGTKLAECKSRLAQLYEQLDGQTKEFYENKQNLDSLSSQYNPDTIMALLRTSVAQLEESSEEMADSFLEGEVTVEDFLEKYVKDRSELHVRRTKVDKLKEIMRHRNVLTT